MSQNSKLILIDINREFISYLKEKIKDGRVYIFNDSVLNIRNILRQCNEAKADYVISGIPFSHLSPELKTNLIKTTKQILKRNGKFLVYQLTSQLRSYLTGQFENVDLEIELFNIPPLVVFEATKQKHLNRCNSKNYKNNTKRWYYENF